MLMGLHPVPEYEFQVVPGAPAPGDGEQAAQVSDEAAESMQPHRVAVVGGGLNGFGPVASVLAAQASAAKQCLKKDTAVIYKYTLTSSSPLDDGLWSDDLFGCSYRDVTDAHGCAELGKTSCCCCCCC